MLRAIFRLALTGCPADVRRDYRDEMEQLFLHCVAVESARRGRIGRVVAVGRGLLDAVVFSIDARRSQRSPVVDASFADVPRRLRAPMRLRDVRETLRFMRKQPFLSGAIVAMLALGLGASTAIFSVVYGVLLKPLPFPATERIVQVWGEVPHRQIDRMVWSEANFWDLHDTQRTFEDFGAWHGASFSLSGNGEPQRLRGARVTVGFFRALGVRPEAGRLFEPGEDRTGGPMDRVLLAHSLWMTRFAGDRGIVGQTLTLDGRPVQVVGVLPPGTPWLDGADIFVPMVRRPKPNRTSWEYAVIGRMKSEASVEAALGDLKSIARDLERYPENQGFGVNLQRADTWVASDDLRRTLWVLLGAVCLLLVIACVNVTNLLLARASGRVRESAVRTALGAGRGDLIRERLTESLILSGAGAAAGWLVAIGMLRILRAYDPGGIPRLADVTLNGWVLLFAVGVTVLVGVLTGLAPALQAPLRSIVTGLRYGQRGTIGDRRHQRVRSTLVAAEVALSLMLLIGAGLLVRSLIRVLDVDRGFATDRRLFVTVSLPAAYGESKLATLTEELLTRVESLPQLVSMAVVSGRPLSSGSTGLGIVAADDAAPATVPWATWRIVTKDYFRTLGLTLLAGRGFNEQDIISKPWRVVLSKRLADSLWPGHNPIGRTAILWKGQGEQKAEVIGIVSDMRERGLENDPTLAVYFPAYGALGGTTLQLVMHTKGNPEDVVPTLRSTIAGVDPTLPISGIRTLEEIVSTSVATRRFTMLLLVTFAGLAVVLALAGVYGVLAYSISRRTSEIGVRLALGAQQGKVLRLVLLQGLRPVLIGAAIGLALAFWMSSLMATLLFGIEPRDMTTYAVVSAALLATALLASYLPARQVLRVDPVVALRAE